MEEDTEAMQEELREAFRMYDKEGNGYIPTSALREILRALDDKLTEDELDEMIAEIDTDGSGTVDFDGMPGKETQLLNLNWHFVLQNSWKWWLAIKVLTNLGHEHLTWRAIGTSNLFILRITTF